MTPVSPQATILVFQALAQYHVALPRQLELNLDVSVLLPRRANAITYRIENNNALVARSAEVRRRATPVTTVTGVTITTVTAVTTARGAILVTGATVATWIVEMRLAGAPRWHCWRRPLCALGCPRPSPLSPVPTDQAERGLHCESRGHWQGDNDSGDRLQRQSAREGKQV